ncbi:uncharacterized protein LOC128960063 [Oppia nitens]|uniref:uncharacterized protein LOC128960063 n=1 Tax=Oppia nitens TaxID=1686743 RepID=UPI0023DC37B2|nr:uncharacterized protein LOC128960063 [Oppia nitens]
MPDDTVNTSATTADVHHISVKPPPFWTNNPTFWFIQLEAQFAIARVTNDDTKYSHVVTSLTETVFNEVQDIVSSPPTANKYEAIKKALIDRLSVSNNKRLQQLLHSEELGDRTPSQLLRKLRSLAGTSITDDVLKNIWMSRLPTDAQKILTVTTVDLDSLARIADQLNEQYPSAVNSVSTKDKQIEELTKQVKQLVARDRGRSKSRNRSRDRSNSRQRDGKCWYHFKFGDKARKCNQPCNHQQGNESGSQ